MTMTAAEVQAKLAAMEAEREAQRQSIISHVRSPLPKSRPSGNQFYKDPGLKGRFGPQRGTTVCGAEPTTEDMDHPTALRLARKGGLDQWVKCPDCREQVRVAG